METYIKKVVAFISVFALVVTPIMFIYVFFIVDVVSTMFGLENIEFLEKPYSFFFKFQALCISFWIVVALFGALSRIMVIKNIIIRKSSQNIWNFFKP